MPVKSISILKSYFNRGDKPTEGQFADLIDSFRHKNEDLSVNDVSGLQGILNGLVTQSDLQNSVLSRFELRFTASIPTGILPASKLVFKVVLISPTTQTVSLVAQYPSGDEVLFLDIDLLTNKPMVGEISIYTLDALTLRMDGVLQNVTGIFFIS